MTSRGKAELHIGCSPRGMGTVNLRPWRVMVRRA